MLNFDRSFFFKCSLLALLVAPACADKDGDDEPTDGDSTAAGTSSASGGNATSNTSSNTSSNTTSNTSTSTSGTSGDTGGGQACAGDWTLGSVPFTGDPTLGQACDGNPPKNCADGTYIMFGTGECVCIAMCSSLGKEVGQSCTDNGQWVCQDIEATNASMNSAKACVNKDWNLCTKGGGGGTTSTSGGGTTSTSGGTSSTSGGSCAPSGSPCTFSDDCCSQDCSFDLCA